MPIFFTAESKPLFVRRINAVTPASQRQFGSLEPVGMIRHLRLAMELSLGEANIPDTSNIFGRTIGRYVAFHLIPWPKGKIKAPPAFTPPPEKDFDTERVLLNASIDRFIATLNREPQKVVSHPVFGAMTMTYWTRVHGKHFDHHLKQFGV
jgi:hypothetical protein